MYFLFLDLVIYCLSFYCITSASSSKRYRDAMRAKSALACLLVQTAKRRSGHILVGWYIYLFVSDVASLEL